MKTIRVENISAGYEEKTIIHSASFEIIPNKLTSLVGPSGSGKSTLLKAIAGFIGCNGRIFVEDQDVHQLAPNLRPVTLMFQEPRLFPHLKVKENIHFPMTTQRFKKMKRPEGASFVDKLIIDVGLEQFTHKYPHQLSGGQKQRVALARAVASFSSLLLLDEPFSALDEGNRQKMYELLMEMAHKYGLTILMVTHSVPEAVSYSDNIVVMQDGFIIQSANTEMILQRPLTFEVAKTLNAGIYNLENYISFKNILTHPTPSSTTLTFNVSRRQSTLRGERLYFDWKGIENSIEQLSTDLDRRTLTLHFDPMNLVCFSSK